MMQVWKSALLNVEATRSVDSSVQMCVTCFFFLSFFFCLTESMLPRRLHDFGFDVDPPAVAYSYPSLAEEVVHVHPHFIFYCDLKLHPFWLITVEVSCLNTLINSNLRPFLAGGTYENFHSGQLNC